MNERFMQEALDLAVESVGAGGGPFGAVVVREGEVLARGANEVTATSDPTAHAEIVAIRRACQRFGRFDLKGCALYASCEPCPMCLGAIYWARLGRVFYAATREDAARAGFDDAHIYREIDRPPDARDLAMTHLPHKAAGRPFAAWAAHEERVEY